MKLKQFLEQLNQLAKDGHNEVYGVRVFEMPKNRPDFVEIF